MLKYLVLTLLPYVSSSCVDTPGWRDEKGYECDYYVGKGICSADDITSQSKYYEGKEENFPTLNCCECGKKNLVYFEKPSYVPNRCTRVD